jgi:hypothetical protein
MPLIPFALIPNVIEDDMDNQTDANLFSFAMFADKHTGMLYNDLTGTFPFMSLEGNVCFLVVYHYESNDILALPISGFSNNIIFQAYKQIYEMIESKGSVIRFNIMDNQASKVIKKFLTPKQCDWMLVEPNNHRVNAFGARNSNIQRSFYQRFGNNKQQISIATMGSTRPTSWDNSEYVAPVTHQSIQVGLRGTTRSIRLEPISACSTRMQGGNLKNSRIANVMGQPRHQRVVRRAVSRPLPLQSLFCAGHVSVLDLRIRQIISTALPGTLFIMEWTFARSNWWACNNVAWFATE